MEEEVVDALGRPRLEALRKQLSQEDRETPELKGAINHQTNKQNRKSSSSIISVNKTKNKNKNKKDNSIHDLITKLPDIELPPNTTSILEDRFARQHSYLRISLSERCNLRCLYCMPEEGVPLQPGKNLLTRAEIFELVQLFHRHGVDKIRLTGGEPLLRKDLREIIKDISSLSGIRQIGMTTNAITLSRKLPALVEAGLTHVNISLDTLKPERFQQLTRRPGLNKVWQSLEQACQILPKGRVKLNCVVMRGINDDELVDFCLLTKDLPLDVRFIEWMPFLDSGWSQNRLLNYAEMLENIQSSTPLERLSDGPNDTTKWYSVPDAQGRIGFITSMSQHFCATCNRLRLTADGQIKVHGGASRKR